MRKTKKPAIERKIIEAMYRYEATHTVMTLILKLFGIVLSVLLVLFSGQILIEILEEEKTLDMFDLFKEDQIVIRKYFFDTMITFYQETPKIFVVLAVVGCVSFCIVAYTLVRNFPKIKNRVRAIFHHWHRIKTEHY